MTNTPEKQGTLDLDGASRGFGLLLHAFALKTEAAKTEACIEISQEVCNHLDVHVGISVKCREQCQSGLSTCILLA